MDANQCVFTCLSATHPSRLATTLQQLHILVVVPFCIQGSRTDARSYMGGGAGPAGQVLAGPLFCLINS